MVLQDACVQDSSYYFNALASPSHWFYGGYRQVQQYYGPLGIQDYTKPSYNLAGPFSTRAIYRELGFGFGPTTYVKPTWTAPCSHNDTYASTCHRVFFANRVHHVRDAVVCPVNDTMLIRIRSYSVSTSVHGIDAKLPILL